jgi:predicted nucleic acid-binding protein
LTSFVVDASVAVKWLELFVNEPLVHEANRILQRRIVGDIDVLVPDLFWTEVASVLCKAVRRKTCTPQEAKDAIAVLERQQLTTVPSPPLLSLALEIAMGYGRSIYDSVYVALARASYSELVTADERLANALAAHLPVKWLGAL